MAGPGRNLCAIEVCAWTKAAFFIAPLWRFSWKTLLGHEILAFGMEPASIA